MILINRHPENPFPVICKWCGKVYRTSTVKGSHGICQPCAAKFQQEIDEYFKK